MEAGSVRVIDRASAMLSAFSVQRPELSLKELAATADIAPSTAHRILASLASNDLIERRVGDHLYRLGPRAAAIGNAVLAPIADQRIEDLLNKLRDETRESVGLTRRLSNDALVIARAHSRLPLSANVEAGTLFPGHATSAGRVLLSFLSENELEKKFRNVELVQYTPSTPSSGDELLSILAEIRDNGYAIERDSFVTGLTGIAVAVPADSGPSTLAVGISASSAQWGDGDILSLLPALRATAEALAEHTANGSHSGTKTRTS